MPHGSSTCSARIRRTEFIYSEERPVAVRYVYVICARAWVNCVACAGVIVAGSFKSPALAKPLIIVAIPEFA